MGGWVLDLGDSGDAIHVMFVEVFSGMVFCFLFLFLILGSKAHCGACFQTSLIGVFIIGDFIIVVFICILFLVKT